LTNWTLLQIALENKLPAAQTSSCLKAHSDFLGEPVPLGERGDLGEPGGDRMPGGCACMRDIKTTSDIGHSSTLFVTVSIMFCMCVGIDMLEVQHHEYIGQPAT
jgi:hypothetical protein